MVGLLFISQLRQQGEKFEGRDMQSMPFALKPHSGLVRKNPHNPTKEDRNTDMPSCLNTVSFSTHDLLLYEIIDFLKVCCVWVSMVFFSILLLDTLCSPKTENLQAWRIPPGLRKKFEVLWNKMAWTCQHMGHPALSFLISPWKQILSLSRTAKWYSQRSSWS